MRTAAYRVGVCAVIGSLSGLVTAKPPTQPDERTMRVIRDLERPVPRVAFDEEPFVDVVDWLRANALKNVMVHWRTLENAGYVDRDTPVTVDLRDLPLAEVLDWILRDVSQEAPPEDQVRYAVERGVLIIAPRRTFDDRMVARLYSVEHLLQGRWMWSDAPEIKVADTSQGAGGQSGGTAGSSGPIITGGEGETAFDFDARRGEQVARLIEVLHTLRPETWDLFGGRGTVEFMNGFLVVTQTHEVHEMIGGLRSSRQVRASR